ncbi:MAG: deoxyribodipyrimidine photo-lyase [Chloroflexota bacterium]
MKRLIWWCRRDLRLADNTALNAALNDADEVIPVYVLDDKLLSLPRVQGPRIAWMLDGLRILDSDLRRHGASLVLRRGDPVVELIAVCRESDASRVYFNRDYGPYATERDQAVMVALQSQGFEVQSFKDLVIHELPEVVTGQGTTYGVFTPYRTAWNKLPKPEVIDNPHLLKRLHVPSTLYSIPFPNAADLNSIPVQVPIATPSESAAAQRLEQFVAEPIYSYADQRNVLATDGTAILSPYLRWGMISPRTCYWAAQRSARAVTELEQQRSVDSWISELTWREFSYQNLANNPRSVRHNFRPIYDKLMWDNNLDWLAAWREGRTGYPVVDAAMRQMRLTGWMHNRARLIAASFLCKDLLIDWRLERVMH